MFFLNTTSYNLLRRKSSNVVHKIVNNNVVKVSSDSLEVGDVLVLSAGDYVQADIVILSTSSNDDSCLINTCLIDESSEVSRKFACDSTAHNKTLLAVAALKGEVLCELPCRLTTEFQGTLKLYGYPRTSLLNIDNVILSGSQIYYTNIVYGVAVYVGDETRIRQNTAQRKKSGGVIGSLTDYLIISLLVFMAFYFYLGLYLNSQRSLLELAAIFRDSKMLLIVDLIINIPLSYIFGIDIVRFIYCYKIYMVSDKKFKPKWHQKIENFVHVDFVFASKSALSTGKKQLFSLMLNSDSEDIEIWRKSYKNNFWLSSGLRTIPLKYDEFFKTLLICSSVKPKKLYDPESECMSFKAHSIHDECIARELVQVGYYIKYRDCQDLILSVRGFEEKIVIIGVNGTDVYTPYRERVSVVAVQGEECYVFCKGTPDAMLPILKDPNSVNRINAKLRKMKRAGCIATIFAYRKLNLNEKYIYKKLYDSSRKFQGTTEGKTKAEIKAVQAAAYVEDNLIYSGMTGIIEKPYPQVKSTVYQFKNSDVKLWILSGDSAKNCVRTARSSKFISKNHYLIGNIKVENSSIQLKNDLLNFEKEFKKIKSQNNNSEICFIMTAHNKLEYILSDEIRVLLVYLTFSSSLVIIGNLLPHQKSFIAKLVQDSLLPPPRTLAIGKGPNDYDMMMSADVSVSVQDNTIFDWTDCSDVVVENIQGILPLMFRHGKNTFIGLRLFLYFSVYKGVLLVTPFIIYSYNNHISETFLYRQKFLYYDIILTLIPLLSVTIFDKHHLNAYNCRSVTLFLETVLRLIIWSAHAFVLGAFIYLLVCNTFVSFINYTAILDIISFPYIFINYLAIVFNCHLAGEVTCWNVPIKIGFLVSVMLQVFMLGTCCIFKDTCLLFRFEFLFWFTGIFMIPISMIDGLIFHKILDFMFGSGEKTSTFYVDEDCDYGLTVNVAFNDNNNDLNTITRMPMLYYHNRSLNFRESYLEELYNSCSQYYSVYNMHLYRGLLIISMLTIIIDVLICKYSLLHCHSYSHYSLLFFMPTILAICISFTETFTPLLVYISPIAYFFQVVFSLLYTVPKAVTCCIQITFIFCLKGVRFITAVCFVIFYMFSWCLMIFLHDDDLYEWFTLIPIILGIALITGMIAYRIELTERQFFLCNFQLGKTYDKQRQLLNMLLPSFVVDDILNGKQNTLYYSGFVSVIFCDIYEFQNIVAMLDTSELIKLLDTLFLALDKCTEINGGTKIETVSGSFIAVCGLKINNDKSELSGVEQSCDALNSVYLAIGILEATASITYELNQDKDDINHDNSLYSNINRRRIRLKLGIHAGRVLSGVIGKYKPQFALIGDTVNTASRMSSTGTPDLLHVSQSVHDLVKHDVNLCFDSLVLQIKGKGSMNTYLLHSVVGSNYPSFDITDLENEKPTINTSISFNISAEESLVELNNNFTSCAEQIMKKVFGKDDFDNICVDACKSEYTFIDNKALDPITLSFLDKSLGKLYEDDFYKSHVEWQLNSMGLIIMLTSVFLHCAFVISVFIIRGGSIVNANFYWFRHMFFVAMLFLIRSIIFYVVRYLPNSIYIYRGLIVMMNIIFACGNISICPFQVNTNYYIICLLSFYMVNNTLLLVRQVIRIDIILVSLYFFPIFFSSNRLEQFYLLLPICSGILIYLVPLYILDKFRRLLWLISKKIEQNEEISPQLLLLKDMLPKHVLQDYLNDRLQLVYEHSNITFLCADLAGFTAYADSVEAEVVLRLLQRLFYEFDEECTKLGLYKLCTIGDAYIVITEARTDDTIDYNPVKDAENIIYLAKSMLHTIKKVAEEFDVPELNMRIGLHCGKCVGGILGSGRLRYDIWGIDVLTASKIEANAIPGEIMVSKQFQDFVSSRASKTYNFLPYKLVDGMDNTEMTFILQDH